MELKLQTEAAYTEALNTLDRQQGDGSLLRSIMNRLEDYRQQRQLGWSRPWNKYGVTTFQSFRLGKEDVQWCEQALLLLSELPIPTLALQASEALLHDPAWMGFLFYSEINDDGKLYESVTLSLGRRYADNTRQRDRLDIIWDIPLAPDKSIQDARLRVYIAPLREDSREPLWQYNSNEKSQQCMAMLSQLAEISWQWQEEGDRLWDHWTSRYIDYFGDRHYRPAQCYFYLEGSTKRE